MGSKNGRTEKIIGGEIIGIPDLKLQQGRDFQFYLVPVENGFSPAENNLLFCLQIIEWEEKSPVEVSLSS